MSRKPLGGKRAGAGRPRTVGGSKTVGMGLLLGDSLKADLILAAGELGISENELIRRVLARGLTEKQQLATIQADLRRERRAKDIE